MTDDTVTTVDMDNLDEFENAFFNKASGAPDKPEPDKVEDEEIDEEIPLETDAEPDPDGDEDEDEDELEDEPEKVDPPERKNKKSAKDRIEELVAKNREAERREADLLRRLEALEVPGEKTAPQKPVRELLPDDAPSPDALDDDGEPVYPLGEFDPKFIRDLTKFTIVQEREADRLKMSQEAELKQIEAAHEELKSSWVEKVATAEKDIPDLREALEGMGETFAYVDPDYGDYLAATIMSCDLGPQIMYYLSQNLGEAKKIVSSGPAAATLAIGRLEARLTPTVKEETRVRKVSSAPTPPEKVSRGTGGKFATSADTDDLNAFEREFFKKR